MGYPQDDGLAAPKISSAERAHRQEIVRQADAHNRIEGMFRDKDSDDIFDAYIRGDIEVTDLVPRLKAELGLT